MNWRTILNIMLAIIGVLIIAWSYYFVTYYVSIIGVFIGMVFILIGILLLTKAEWRRALIALVLAFILLAVTYFYVWMPIHMGPIVYNHGWPFPYYGCSEGTGLNISGSNLTAQQIEEIINPHCGFDIGPEYFPYLWLVVDILFWYIISSVIVWIYYRFRKNS